MPATDPKERESVERYFAAGMDSYTSPDALQQGEVAFSLNTVNRGGIYQTRPGSMSLSCLPDGEIQGFTRKPFSPRNGTSYLACAIDGTVYVSRQPFTKWAALPNVAFSRQARFVEFEDALKQTEYMPNGRLQYVETERRVLMMADNRSRTAYWDGGVAAHLNPENSGLEATPPDKDGTPIGQFLCWSGSRLWVARGSRVYAGDIGNPLKASERQYLNEAPAFYLPSPCMGLLDMPEVGGLLAFHEEGVEFIKSYILDRTQWTDAANAPMQRTITSVGCVSHRSIIRQHGMVYWFSPAGLISLNEALRTNTTSQLVPLDMEMAWSKANIGPDLSGIATCAFENYLLVSVPFCDRFNAHTWCMDLAVFDDNAVAWNSVWTGWRPVSWCVGNVSGVRRAFFVSKDLDGHNRLWEAFLPDRRDNGCDITCSVQFRSDPVNNRNLERQRFGYAEVEIEQAYGNVSVMGAIASSRGWWEKILEKEIVATSDRIVPDQIYGDGTDYPDLGSNRPQARKLVSRSWATNQAHNATNVEGRDTLNNDTHFQLFVGWSGRMAIKSYRLHAVDNPNDVPGDKEVDETGFKHATTDGVSSTSEFPPQLSAFDPFTGTATASEDGLNEPLGGNVTIEVAAHAENHISQAAADRSAQCRATQQASILALDSNVIESRSIVTRQATITLTVIYYNNAVSGPWMFGISNDYLLIPDDTYVGATQADAQALADASLVSLQTISGF